MSDESKKIREIIEEVNKKYLEQDFEIHEHESFPNGVAIKKHNWEYIAAQMILEERELVEEMLVANISDAECCEDEYEDEYEDVYQDECENAYCDSPELCEDYEDCEDCPCSAVDLSKPKLGFTNVIYATTMSVCNLSDGILIKPETKKDDFAIQTATYVPGINWDFDKNDCVLI